MKICLSIGANLGRRAATLREALRRLARLKGTRLIGASSFYETAPWGKRDQPPFLNGAALLETTLAPDALLKETQAIETALGRVRHEHWGARTIDLDLVWAQEGEEVIRCNTPTLKLPHPYLLGRAFVLEPLRELASHLVLEGRPIDFWCEKNAGQDVRKTEELAAPYPLQMIACIGRNHGIGKDGKLLFHLPEDMDFFKRQTKTPGSVVILGRKTWESLAQPLAGRTQIVLSRSMKGVPSPLLSSESSRPTSDTPPTADAVPPPRRGGQAEKGTLGNGSRGTEPSFYRSPPPRGGQAEKGTLGNGSRGTEPSFYRSPPPRGGADREAVGGVCPCAPDGSLVVAHTADLSCLLDELYRAHPHRPFWVLGGGEIYRQLLPYTRRILLTEVDAAPPADTFFPALPDFRCTKKRPAKTPGVTFCEYLRE